jgi:hypothetical protein
MFQSNRLAPGSSAVMTQPALRQRGEPPMMRPLRDQCVLGCTKTMTVF